MSYALLIGINYRDTESELSGCENDVDNMEQLLKNKLNYENIIKMTEVSENEEYKPTCGNILQQLDIVIEKCKKGFDLGANSRAPIISYMEIYLSSTYRKLNGFLTNQTSK